MEGAVDNGAPGSEGKLSLKGPGRKNCISIKNKTLNGYFFPFINMENSCDS
jgi:hypothetical protein